MGNSAWHLCDHDRIYNADVWCCVNGRSLVYEKEVDYYWSYCIILVLIGLNIWKSETSTKVAVKTTSLKEASMQETIMTTGVLKMNDEQYVYYQADKGEIDEIEVKAGDAVEKGDNLLVYENKQLDLDKKQNQLDINNA